MKEAPVGDEDSRREPGLFDVVLPDVPLTDLLSRVATLAAREIPMCAAASITVPQRGSGFTPACTDERARRIDEVQYASDTGPCLDAARDGQVHAVEDTATPPPQWRAFCKAARTEGFLSTLSMPLSVSGSGDELLGALNLYSEVLDGFPEAARSTAETFAHQAAILLANARAYWGAVEVAAQLDQAMQSRATIEQAKGILVAQSGVTPDEAFQLLVRASQRQNRKLRDIAIELVERAVDSRRARPPKDVS